MNATPMNQIAISVTDLPRTHTWYRAAFGFVPAGGTNSFKGYLAEKVQGVKGTRSTCWWLVDQQDYFQLELFQFHNPGVRPLPGDWRLCDIGYGMIGLHSTDFDATLARLQALGTAPLSAPLGAPGQRRVCVRDPEGVLLELMEDDPCVNFAQAPVRPAVGVVTRSVTVSVPDLDQSMGFFVDVLGLQLEETVSLHTAQHEALWGLEGAQRKSCLLRAGDSLVELVQYLDPPGKPWPADYRISDQGLLNIALGFRSKKEFNAVYRRCLAAGARGNWRPLNVGNWSVVYVNDAHGFSVELLMVRPWYDGMMGFRAKKNAPTIAVNGLRSLSVECAIAAPPEEVWDAISDHEAMPDWWPLRKVELVQSGTDQRNGVGAVRAMHGLGPVLQEKITSWQAPHRYEYRLIKGAPVKQHKGAVQVLPHGSGSKVVWQIQFRPLIPGTGVLVQWVLRQLINHVLKRFNKLVSAQTPQKISV